MDLFLGIVALLMGLLIYGGVAAIGGFEDPGLGVIGMLLGVVVGLMVFAILKGKR